MMARLVGGVDLSENGQAMEPLLTNGPGRHHLGTAHTMANFEDAFWVSNQSDVDSFEQWEMNGSLDSVGRANALAGMTFTSCSAWPGRLVRARRWLILFSCLV